MIELEFCGVRSRIFQEMWVAGFAWGLPPLCNLRTRLSVRAACAVVFLKVLLRKAVERERRNSAF